MDQKGAVLLFLCSIVYIAPLVLCNDGAFKILGGYVDVYNDDSSQHKTQNHHWGEYDINGYPDRKAFVVTSHFCWDNGRSYCYQTIVVSTSSDETEQHYQIMGSKTVIYDATSSYVVDSRGWGVQDTFDQIEDKVVDQGEIWAEPLNDWGHGYLHLFVRKEARPSYTDAFFRENRNAGSEQFTSGTKFYGQKDPSSVSEVLSNFRSWTTAWGDASVHYFEVFTMPTKLVKTTTLYDEKVSKPIDLPVLKSLTLTNYGSGATGDDFALIGTEETFDLSTESTISTSFDFEIDVGAGTTIDAFGIGVSMYVNLHSSYSSGFEQKETKTVTTTRTIMWPSTCPAGMQVKHIITSSSEEVKIPIVFTFARGDLRWTERKIMEATMSDLKQEKYDCCLWAEAHDLCGTQGLPLCSQ